MYTVSHLQKIFFKLVLIIIQAYQKIYIYKISFEYLAQVSFWNIKSL